MNQRDEKLLREFVRREMVKPILEQRRKEEKVRIWVRGLIREANEENYLSTLFEAKDMANPHPNTGINKLRDAIRKAKPSIKAKYQQLTTDGTQRESFTNHFLTAMVRLFDELDALNAQGREAEDVAGEIRRALRRGFEIHIGRWVRSPGRRVGLPKPFIPVGWWDY